MTPAFVFYSLNNQGFRKSSLTWVVFVVVFFLVNLLFFVLLCFLVTFVYFLVCLLFKFVSYVFFS